jgi:hypothetical protein
MARLAKAGTVRGNAPRPASKGREIPINQPIDVREVMEKSRSHVTDINIAVAPHERRPISTAETTATRALERVDRRMAWSDAEKAVDRQRLERLARMDAEVERDTLAHPIGTSEKKQAGTTTKAKKSTQKQKAEKAAKAQATRDETTRVKEEHIRDLRIKRLQDKLVKEGYDTRAAWSGAYDAVTEQMDAEKEARAAKSKKKASKTPVPELSRGSVEIE